MDYLDETKLLPSDPESINLKQVVLIGVVSSVLLVISFVVLMDYFTLAREQTTQEVVLSVPSASLEELRVAAKEKLTSYALVDSSANRYRIPLDRAMNLMVAEAESETGK